MKPLLRALSKQIISCRLCPRLVNWREEVAKTKRRSYRDWTYWGRPLPGFGDPEAELVLLGLAPAAHGANRTGRMFTGDRSGDFLFAALHRAGLANQPGSKHRNDGLALRGAFITAACRCAPPENKPTPAELKACSPFLERELRILGQARVVLALGKIAFDTYLNFLRNQKVFVPKPRPKFRHGAVYRLKEWPHVLVGVYHPSQQNTNTGRLTPVMFDKVLKKAVKLTQFTTKVAKKGKPSPI